MPNKNAKNVITTWKVNPFNAGTVFIRQILTYKDGLRAERNEIFIIWPYTYNIGIEMKWKELTKTFIMISSKKTTLVSHVLCKNNSAL